MAIYMDRHDAPGVTASAVAEASARDVEVQGDYGVEVMTYWVDEERGYAFCLMNAPDKQSVRDMHSNSHGMIPHEIIEVNSNVVSAFLGRIYDPGSSKPKSTATPSIFNDPAFRTIMVTDLKDRIHYNSRFGKKTGSDLMNGFYDLTREAIHDFGGLLVEKHDEVLASFQSVTNAVECALHMQKMVRAQNSLNGLPEVELNLGISAGVPVTENNDIFGDAIQIAKRLCAFSQAGGILTTSMIRELYKGSKSDAFNEPGMIRALTSAEELLLTRLLDAFQESLTDREVRMDDFCRELGLSKSQLYRKTVNLTGLSPMDLLTELRLNNAVILMKKENMNISETTYELGFTNPSYFTRIFKKRFSVLPTEFIKDLA